MPRAELVVHRSDRAQLRDLGDRELSERGRQALGEVFHDVTDRTRADERGPALAGLARLAGGALEVSEDIRVENTDGPLELE
jgi:hypothetical protein